MTGPEFTHLIAAATEQAERDGVAIDGEPGGAVHRWVIRNVRCRPEQHFWIVFLLTAELADREARSQGFESQAHKAAVYAFAHPRKPKSSPRKDRP